MSKSLFAVNGPNGPMFLNPANVVGIFPLPDGKTMIASIDGFESDTTDDIRDVVDRYQTAIKSSNGYYFIVEKMKHYTRKEK